MTAAAARSGLDAAASDESGDHTSGWYLYGITRRGPLESALAEANAALLADEGLTAAANDGAALPLELLECSELAAVVRPVPLSDFSPAILRERLNDESQLEAMVRSHNRVIEAIHARQAILPAKFGAVYRNTEEIMAALQSARDTLVPQLDRLEGCDEWAMHVYANRAVVRDRLAAESPTIARLRKAHAAARPGRAYFLERQLESELESATETETSAVAQSVFDKLIVVAVAGHTSPIRAVADTDGETEILRAAFLVTRDDAERFEAELRAAADAAGGLRSECSGPWPPYSFASSVAEEVVCATLHSRHAK